MMLSLAQNWTRGNCTADSSTASRSILFRRRIQRRRYVHQYQFINKPAAKRKNEQQVGMDCAKLDWNHMAGWPMNDVPVILFNERSGVDERKSLLYQALNGQPKCPQIELEFNSIQLYISRVGSSTFPMSIPDAPMHIPAILTFCFDCGRIYRCVASIQRPIPMRNIRNWCNWSTVRISNYYCFVVTRCVLKEK